MGRNFFSVCDQCGVQTMHLRGKEGKSLHKFANDHDSHRHYVRVLDDYTEEPPEGYRDVFDEYHPSIAELHNQNILPRKGDN